MNKHRAEIGAAMDQWTVGDYQDRAEIQKMYRAGLVLGKCAVDGSPIEGRGICSRCEGAIVVLGGLDGLKKAVRAVRYLEAKE